MTLKAKSALDKAPHTYQYAKDLLDSGEVENLVIFTDHIKSSEAIASALKVSAINSTVSIDARQLIVDRFLNGLDKVLVATIGTLSTGVTLTNTHTMLFNDLPFVSGDIEQAKKRIHRIGQEKDCNYIYMVSGSIDEIIIKGLRSKAKTIEAVV
jgi:SNF2 family DNA or RNA helicase